MIDQARKFIREDYQSHKWRLMAEVTGMGLSIAVSLLLAYTTPHPPMLACYVLWMIASVLLLGAAASRNSVGFVALYSGFLVIDGVGLIRTVMA